MLILDTDHVSILEWERGAEYERLCKRLTSIPAAEVATTIISYEEQTRGWLAYIARARKLRSKWRRTGDCIGIWRSIERSRCSASTSRRQSSISRCSICDFALGRQTLALRPSQYAIRPPC